MEAVFICQAVPAAVTALPRCFQHIWFVPAAIQGVTAAKARVSLSPPEITLSFEFGGCQTRQWEQWTHTDIVTAPRGATALELGLAEAQSHADLPIPVPLRILLVLSEAQYACAAYHT